MLAMQEGTPLDISHLEAALHPESSVPMKIAELWDKLGFRGSGV